MKSLQWPSNGSSHSPEKAKHYLMQSNASQSSQNLKPSYQNHLKHLEKNKLKQRHPDRLRRLCTPSASTEPSAPALAPLASTCSFSAGLDWLISTWRCRNRRRFCVWENHGRFREIRSKNRKVERIVEIIWIRYCHNVFFFQTCDKRCSQNMHCPMSSCDWIVLRMCLCGEGS